jgi:hypothetical protein
MSEENKALVRREIEEPFMSGRPWLEALKATVKEHGAEAEEISERIPEPLPSEGCERCKRPIDELNLAVNSAQLLPAIRDLYSRHPEYFHHEPWELQHVLYSLNYTDDLADEAEIAAAVEVARENYPQWRPAA